MNPYTGEPFTLGPEVAGPAVDVGAMLDMDRYRQRLEDSKARGHVPTPDELRAAQQQALVAVSGEAAQVARLGHRELDRRKRRRKAAKQARQRQR